MKTGDTTSPFIPPQRGTSEGARQRGTILRDKTLDWFERFFNGKWFDGFCIAFAVIAALYFGGVAVWKVFLR